MFSGRARVFLGHTRLRIIDLSEAGRQPMSNEDGTLWLTFNGEIYNYVEERTPLVAKGHRFSSQTDTEVILHAYEEYGPDCVHRLNGMFAFGLWDTSAERLWLVRDRLGVKPLLYARTPWGVAFASEMRSLLACPDIDTTVDPEAVSLYFSGTYVPDPWTIYRGVRKLPPGCMLTIDRDGERLDRYWDVGTPRDGLAAQPAHALEEQLHHLVADATRVRLRSDVPLGAFLSGGIDSSIVVAHMARHSASRIRTFFIGYQHSELGDESPYARAVAKRYDTDHHEIVLSPSDILKRVPEILDAFDEPFADSSALPTYEVCRAIREHVVVALSGDGGDEMFGGYRRYLAEAWVRTYLRLPAAARHASAAVVRRLPDSKGSRLGEIVRRARIFVNGYAGDRLDRHAAWQAKIDSSEASFFGPGLVASWDARSWRDHIRRIGAGYAGDSINTALYIDAHNSLPGDMLTKVDLMSMRHALEVRSPLLDYRVAEFAFALPGHFKVGMRSLKRVLKSSHRELLPESLHGRPKYGFEVPVGEWLKRDPGFRGLFWEVVTDPRIREARLFDENQLRTMFVDHERNRRDYTHRLWPILAFAWWYSRRNRARAVSGAEPIAPFA
jgi:asparagine synthase (glutamine-hydrolysing)